MIKIIIGFLMMLFCGCASMIAEPKVTVQKTSIIGVDSLGVELELYLAVSNPNSFDLSLLGYMYDLRVQTLPFANGGAHRTIKFPGGKSTDVALPVRIKYVDMIELLKRFPDPDKIPYTITARLQIDSPVGEFSIPIDESGTFAIPEKYRLSKILRKLRDSLPDLSL